MCEREYEDRVKMSFEVTSAEIRSGKTWDIIIVTIWISNCLNLRRDIVHRGETGLNRYKWHLAKTRVEMVIIHCNSGAAMRSLIRLMLSQPSHLSDVPSFTFFHPGSLAPPES